MKHPPKIIFYLLVLFFLIELFGMLSVTYYFRNMKIIVTNEEKENFFSSLLFGFLFITLLFIIILYLKKNLVVNVWYYISIFFAMFLTLNIFFNEWISLIFTILLMFLRKSSYRNITEFFIYPGIVAIMLPFFGLKHIILLMVIFAIYDFISVRITKHMIFLAKGQMQNNAFAGLELEYSTSDLLKGSNKTQKKDLFNKSFHKQLIENQLSSKKSVKLESNGSKAKVKLKHINDSIIKDAENKSEIRTAILGGGDVAFPMLFTSFLSVHYGIKYGIFALIGALIGLSLVFFRSKNKFYPALPYIISFMFLTTTFAFYL